MDWNKIVIRPLLEKNMFNGKEGEVILDKNTGHVTIKHNGKYKSKTKELEARVNALLGLKNQLVKKYIEIADEIELLVSEFDRIKKRTKEIKAKAEELYDKLMELEQKINILMSQIDRFCLSLKNFQYKELRVHLDPIIANLRQIIYIKANIDELVFLARDIKDQKMSNSAGISYIG